jgi:hypothetical protein
MRIHLELDEQTTSRLMQIALEERRSLAWQLELLVQRAVAEWFMPPLRENPPAREPAGGLERGT